MVVAYRQCLLMKQGESCLRWQVGYIPENLAEEGLSLRLRSAGGWEAGWIVRRVYNARLTQYEHELGATLDVEAGTEICQGAEPC